MLKSLSIQNYALIDKIHIEFYQGYSVITGETGAGKSIVLGALGLILGNRADMKVIKDKNRKCVVEGEFSVDQIDIEHFFIENDLDYDDVTILRREINNSGKSRAFINDSPVSLNLLKEISERLINIHSQHQTLNLSKFEFQLNALDAFINEPTIIKEYELTYDTYRKLEKQVNDLKSRNEKLKTDEDYLRFQLNELESVKLDRNIIKQLTERENLLTHSEEIASGIMQCEELLNENEINANNLIDEVLNTLTKLSGFHSSIKSIAQRLESVSIESKDISSEITRLSEEIEFNPNELQQIKDKLDVYYSLQQKHHVQSIDELISLKNEYSEKLRSIENIDTEIKEAELLLTNKRNQINNLAEKLHTGRVKFSKKMSSEVRSILRQLGMKNAEFIVEVNRLDDFTDTGFNRIEFLFNANKGGTPQQLSRVASGGELSRLMLAIKSLINQRNVLPTVIFDEIDAGVSGEIAGKVGNIIKEMSKEHQVLVITHLPQIASKAQYHYNVYKIEDTNSTITKIELLDADGRVGAIARMLTDDKVTETTIKAAQELIH